MKTEPKENDISGDIVDAAYPIHNALGPGLLESVYEIVLAHELTRRGHRVERQAPIPVRYENLVFDVGFRADLLVDGLVLVELKSFPTNPGPSAVPGCRSRPRREAAVILGVLEGFPTPASAGRTVLRDAERICGEALKSIERVAPVHKKQVLTYIRLADKRLGLLLNFGANRIKDGITRLVNGLPD